MDNREPLQLLTPIAKRDRPRQIAYGVVLEPNDESRPDLQGDFYDAASVELAAHGFMAEVTKGDGFGDVLHDNETRAGYPVESFIAPADFMLGDQPVVKGSWVMGMHYPDSAIWERIESGELAAFSVGGTGRRI